MPYELEFNMSNRGDCADWYRAHAAGEDMLRFSEAQIAQFQTVGTSRKGVARR